MSNFVLTLKFSLIKTKKSKKLTWKLKFGRNFTFKTPNFHTFWPYNPKFNLKTKISTIFHIKNTKFDNFWPLNSKIPTLKHRHYAKFCSYPEIFTNSNFKIEKVNLKPNIWLTLTWETQLLTEFDLQPKNSTIFVYPVEFHHNLTAAVTISRQTRAFFRQVATISLVGVRK